MAQDGSQWLTLSQDASIWTWIKSQESSQLSWSLIEDICSTGIKCANDELKKVLSICNDMIVHGFKKDGIDHYKVLGYLLPRARERSCRFNPENFVLKASEIPFIGHIIAKNGIKPDPKKQKRNATPRECKATLQFSWIGHLPEQILIPIRNFE